MAESSRKAKGRFLPRAMREAPVLDHGARVGPPVPRRALLLTPFYPKDPNGSFGKHVLTPATTMSALVAATPPDWEVAFWDENLLQGPPPVEPFPAVVGITVHLTFARRAYELARWYRTRGAKVVLGGLHVTACPDEAAPHADAIAIGEGVSIWPEILADAERGALKPRYVGCPSRPFREEPAPRREVLPRRSYLTTASLIATRGCHNRCDFCYLATQGVRAPYQVREPSAVAAELGASPEPYGVFIDNNLGSRKAYLRALCRALAPVGKIWSAAVSLDVTDDEALVREMALAGCTGVFVGLETLTAANLRDAGKRTPGPEDYGRRVGLFHRYGIQVNGSFVFGFDHDGPDVFDRTVEWIEEVRLECATFHILTPYPGTPLFARLEAEGRVLHRDWELYDTAHVVFRPKGMTPDELQAGYEGCYRRLFAHGSIWRRRPEAASEVLPYLAMSYLYKHTNRLWPLVIRAGLTHALWRPLTEAARLRNLAARRRLASARHEPVEERPEREARGGEADRLPAGRAA